jgi:hypothetical protein
VYQRSLSLAACNCKTAIQQGQNLATQTSVAVGVLFQRLHFKTGSNSE